jgi:hypothetical protein
MSVEKDINRRSSDQALKTEAQDQLFMTNLTGDVVVQLVAC